MSAAHGRLPYDRQLLDRGRLRSPVEVTEAVAGLNAQTARGPSVGIWTRSSCFDQADLDRDLRSYKLVKANLMRATVHLVTARQYLSWRRAIHPVLQRTVRQYLPRIVPSREEALVKAASDFLREAPSGLSRADLGRRLAERFPDAAPAHLGFAARLLCPVVQVADPTVWNPGRTRYVLAERVLPHRALDDPESGRADLLRSYLRAFGPATAADLTAWSGLTHLAPALRNLEGVQVRNETGREVFEMPGHRSEPRPAIVLPEFDNLFFCRRPPDPATAEAKRRLLPNPTGVMRGAVVVNGEVRAAWWREPGTDRLHVEEWEPLGGAAADEFDAFREWYRATSQRAGALD